MSTVDAYRVATPLRAQTRLRPRRFRLGRLLRLLGTVLSVAAASAVGWWIAIHPVFGVRVVEVDGTSRIPGEWAAQRLARFRGRHLLTVSAREVREHLADHPWIAGVGVRKRLPDVLEVELSERRPMALLRREGQLFYLEAGGELIAPYDPTFGGTELTLVSYNGRPPVPLTAALELVEEIQRVAPAWALGLSELEILGDGDYRLYTSVLPYPVLLRAGGAAGAIERLERVLAQIRRRYPRVAALDLRFDRRIVVQPMTRAADAAPGA